MAANDQGGEELVRALETIPTRERQAVARAVFDRLPREQQWEIFERAFGDAEIRAYLDTRRQERLDEVRRSSARRALAAAVRAANALDTRNVPPHEQLILGLFAESEASVIRTTGTAEAARTRALGEATAAAEQALGLARAKGFAAQSTAIGSQQTAMVAALREVSSGGVKIVPDIQVGGDGGDLAGLGAMLMRTLAERDGSATGSNGAGEYEVVDDGAEASTEDVVDYDTDEATES